MTKTERFAGLTVLITGAGAGIGEQLVYRYAQHGAFVIAVDRHEQHVNKVIDSALAEGANGAAFVADVSVPEQITSLMKEVEQRFGRLDILINNAGLGIWKDPLELELDEWDYVVNTNLRGSFLCSREAAKIMLRNKQGGSIINISSTRALMSEANSEAYAASKGGILSLTHAMAVSLGKYKVRVNAICPGWIETGDYEALRELDHHQHPAQRVGKPDDIVKACFYLSDPENDFVTGTDIVVDGGMTKLMLYEE